MKDTIVKVFENVDTKEEIENIATISSIVWSFTYKDILSSNQIKYMLNKFLSFEAIKKQMDEGTTFTLLYNEAKVKMGFIAYSFDNDGIFLSKVYLLPNFQHSGILNEIIKHLKVYNQSITLTVNKHNINAIKAYEKYGFKRIKSIVTDIGEGYVMDDYVMKLEA